MNITMDFAEKLPKEWSDWATTNIMRGSSKETIIHTLKSNNFSDTQITATLNNILNTYTNESKKDIRKLPNNLKEWVGINLLQGVSKDDITQVLLQNGYTHAEVLLELETACKSPYLQAGFKPTKMLSKREWLLQTCDDLAKLDPGYNQKIDVIDTPPFDVFIRDYYSKNS